MSAQVISFRQPADKIKVCNRNVFERAMRAVANTERDPRMAVRLEYKVRPGGVRTYIKYVRQV